MKNSLNIDNKLLDNASNITGISDKNALIKAGLEALLTKQHQQRVFDNNTKQSSEFFAKKHYQKLFSKTSFVTPNKALSQLINHYGIALCEEPKRCEALLRDSCGGKHKREISLLINALKEKVVLNLLNQPLWLSKKKFFSYLTSRLHKSLGLDKKLSAWAVNTWANSLNKIAKRRLYFKTLAIISLVIFFSIVFLLIEPEVTTQVKLEPIIPEVIEKKPAIAKPIKTIPLTIRSNVYHDKVFINGKAYGATPLYNIELAPGLYTLRVEKPNYIPFEQQINLQQTKTIRVKLRRTK